jgi:N-acetylneuraminic acid mutarotase
MKRHLYILIFISVLLQSCVEGPFEELTFIEDVQVLTEQPILMESNVELSGSFDIIAGNNVQLEVTASYGIRIGNEADLSDSQVFLEINETLDLEPPFTGLSVDIPKSYFSSIETALPYFVQAFAIIDGREFVGAIESFSYQWLPQRSWSSQIPARANPLTFVFEDELYLIGGNSNEEVFTDIWKYSNSTKSVEQVGELPLFYSNRAELVGFELNGFSYIGLGKGRQGELDDRFIRADLQSDPNDWAINSQTFPGGGREGAIAFVVNGKAYVGMGRSFTNFFNDLYEYDENSRSFSLVNIPDNPIKGRTGAIAFTLGNLAYVGMGRSSEGPLNDLWAFDPTSRKWEQKMSFPEEGRNRPIVLTIDNKAVVGMGVSSNTVKNDVFMYDPSTDSWERFGEFPGSLRRGAVGFNIQGKGFIGMGIQTDNNQAVSDFWEFDIEQ